MFDGIQDRSVEIIAIRCPGSDVARVELKDTEAKVAREHRVFLFNLLASPAKTLFGEFSNGTWLAQLVAKQSCGVLSTIFRSKYLR